MSPRARMLAGFLVANGLILAIALASLYLRSAQPPQIQGVLLPDARAIEPFRLLDHHDRDFSNAQLQGQWHLVTYGFSTCPDICPTTLAELTSFTRELETQGRYDDLQLLFYSVDHRRDTPQQLAAYLPFFDPGIIGLTHRDDPGNPHLPFERSLGIISELVPVGGADSAEYQVSHGVTLFLLNPDGELQAVFEPSARPGGLPYFEPQQLLEDYLALRAYLAG